MFRLFSHPALAIEFYKEVKNGSSFVDVFPVVFSHTTAYGEHLSHPHGSQSQWFVRAPEAFPEEMANAAMAESVLSDFQQAGLL